MNSENLVMQKWRPKPSVLGGLFQWWLFAGRAQRTDRIARVTSEGDQGREFLTVGRAGSS
jgi:hypothetical protein